MRREEGRNPLPRTVFVSCKDLSSCLRTIAALRPPPKTVGYAWPQAGKWALAFPATKMVKPPSPSTAVPKSAPKRTPVRSDIHTGVLNSLVHFVISRAAWRSRVATLSSPLAVGVASADFPRVGAGFHKRSQPLVGRGSFLHQTLPKEFASWRSARPLAVMATPPTIVPMPTMITPMAARVEPAARSAQESIRFLHIDARLETDAIAH